MIFPDIAWAQRGSSGPPEHADVEPVNHLPNPYETVRNWGTLPDGRTWGSVSAINVDIDGIHIWAADRCGANSCATSDVDPIVNLDPDGNVVQSFGAGMLIWPHGMDVDSEGNVWVVDSRAANARELQANPDAAGKGHTVIKFSPEGEVLLVLGTPGEAGDPPTHFTDPNDVIVAPDGSIFVAETHGAQFQDEPAPTAKSRISKFAPDGTFIKSFGSWGYEDGQFRSPHSFAMDSQGRLFVADRATAASRFLIRKGLISTRGISSAGSADSSSTRTTSSTPSTRSLTTTTTPAGGRDSESGARRRERSGTSSPSTSRSGPRGWGASDRWAKGSPWTPRATSTQERWGRSRG